MEEHKFEQEPLTQQETNEKDSRFQISYHGKDISIKDMIGQYMGLPFKVLGLDYPEIEMSLGTELPAVEAKMYDVDNIFRLADGSFLIVDYESSFKKVKTVKYINYVTRLINWYDPDGKGITIRVLVIYTCDVLSAKPDYDAGGLKLSVDTFFMRDFPGEEKVAEIKEKIQNKERLANIDLMALVFAPLSVKGNERKNEMASEIIDVAKSIKDEQADDVGFVLAHVATMLGNIMTQEVKDKMWEALEMTWIDERYADEKKKAVDKVTKDKDEEIKRIVSDKDEEIKRIVSEKDEEIKRIIEEKDKELNQKDKELNQKIDRVLEAIRLMMPAGVNLSTLKPNM